MKMTFNTEDMKRIHAIAGDRNDKPEESSNQLSDLDPLRCHVIGVMVEAALSRHYAVPMNTQKLARGDKHQPDLVVYGVGIEVRGATHSPPILKFERLDHFLSEVAMLGYVQLAAATVTVEHWCTREEFMQIYYMRDFGNGPQFCLRAKDMRPLEEFRDVRPL